ncbi:unnamed protein product [Adineta ricciae]|uniref:Uncharacterized protein n=1 Tax=Adineta ricciae TaxID=249248 RepID=A0A815P542_ADIRI|nr:unnamed protein product [Adineta ricciae]
MISSLNYLSTNQTCQLFYANVTTVAFEFDVASSLICMNGSVVLSMLSMTSNTTVSNTTTVSQCNITACRVRIQSYIALNLTYDTINFAECNGCSRANFSNFPSDWSNRWYTVNFYIYSSSSVDCNGNPYTGDLPFCKKACLTDITCVGFSRAKNALDTDSTADCYLKRNITVSRIYNDTTWQSVIFNSTT